MTVRRSADEVSLGSQRQRAVFALLVLADGQPVSRAELVETLWGDRPPEHASNVIQTYVKRLRHSLEPERLARRPSALLHQAGSGYRLTIEPCAVDALIFMRIVESARVARRAGDAAGLVPMVERGLAVANGPLVADVPMLADHPRVTAVGDDQASMVEWYAEAALRHGRAADALRFLTESVARRPFGESLHSWLIRTYSTIGRRADALVAYNRLRLRLNEELGIEPGLALRTLRDSILRGTELPV